MQKRPDRTQVPIFSSIDSTTHDKSCKMPLKNYTTAMQSLPDSDRLMVESAMTAWKQRPGSEDWQLATNVENENGLAPDHFRTLLHDFAHELEKGQPTRDAWFTACQRSILRGKEVPLPSRPKVLGRAEKLGSYVLRTSAVKGDEAAMKNRLVKYAGNARPPASLRRTMANSDLGKDSKIWATFESVDGESPFAGLPEDTESVRTALGLGFAGNPGEPFLLLRWDPGAPEDLPLHRPTIADADTYHCFRPNPDQNSPYGMTHPLPPNPKGLEGQPEVVHRKIVGKGLVFPYHLTTT